MQQVSIDQCFNIPDRASYTGQDDAREIFESLDHPRTFYELTPERQEVLLKWCGGFEKIKRPNSRHTSYGMKHWFEHSEDGFYITNGQFKGAMILTGFSIENPDSLNWTFNVSQVSCKEQARFYHS